VQVGRAVVAVAAVAPRRTRQQPNALIVTDHLGRDAARRRQFADLHHSTSRLTFP
jgi:hypothetical protein